MTCCNYQRCGLLDTILTLPKSGYYYGNITVEEAERMLKNEPNGAFLVRDSRDSSDSENRTDLYTITFKIQNKYGSVRVDYAKGYFSLSLQDSGLPLFRTMMDLVSFCYNRSVVEKLPVCVLTGHSRHQDVHLYLTKPVCRHKQMHSLIFLGREHAHTSTSPRITWTNWDSPRDLWSCTSQRFLSLTRSIFHCTKRKM